LGKRVAIGLDIGGSKIAGGLIEQNSGCVVLRKVIPTLPERGGGAVLEDSLVLTGRLIAEAQIQNRSIIGIGIGICELVDQNGNITDNYLLHWKDLPVRKRFAQLAPTVIESDVRAPALAEALYGAGKPYNLFAYVTVGTGISYALVQDGQPMKGARGKAIVLGSSSLRVHCPHCGEMVSQVLEEFASGPAMVTRYNERSKSQLATGQELMAAVDAGDEVAIEVVHSAGQALGNSVGFMSNLLDPEAIIIGGGVGLAGGPYWEHFVAATRRNIYATDTRSLPILPAKLGVDAGLIGAGAIAMQAFR
jgi:glucokinase